MFSEWLEFNILLATKGHVKEVRLMETHTHTHTHTHTYTAEGRGEGKVGGTTGLTIYEH